ncbi:hypothetical protein EI94DRAFT_1836280 [Lactarius quietus]|nr:hypothetical protein EI94DRAFT_1836280 [Lactarius quietus]
MLIPTLNLPTLDLPTPDLVPDLALLTGGHPEKEVTQKVNIKKTKLKDNRSIGANPFLRFPALVLDLPALHLPAFDLPTLTFPTLTLIFPTLSLAPDVALSWLSPMMGEHQGANVELLLKYRLPVRIGHIGHIENTDVNTEIDLNRVPKTHQLPLKDMRSELRKDLRTWISPPDPSVNYITACKAHHTDTATWCTQGGTYTEWKASGSLLWVHGKPGSGKSILSLVIIRDIKSMSNDSTFMAYFYFDFKDTEKQDSRALLSSLLVQLCSRSEQFCDIFFGLYSKHQDGLEQPTDDSLVRCLEDMLTIATQLPIYLVIDALDECPDDLGVPSSRETVLELVKELVELRHSSLRVCVMSRPEFDIRTDSTEYKTGVLEPLATQQISLHDESGQQQDIIDYITSVVRSDQKMKRWRDDDKDAVTERLTKKADGMFRWVFCQLEVLRHCFPTNLRQILEELPKSLDDTYKRILNEINNANQEHAYRLLQCLTVASRPLRIEELAEVLAVDFNPGGIPKLKTDWRWEDQEMAVLSACSSLVSVIIDNGHRIVQFSTSRTSP